MSFAIVDDDTLLFYYRKVGQIVPREGNKRTVELVFRDKSVCIFLVKQVRIIDDTATWIKNTGPDDLYSILQRPEIENSVESVLWETPELFSWNVIFADVIYPLSRGTHRMPIVPLQNTDEFFELFYNANYVEDDQSNLFVYACGDGEPDIVVLVRKAKAQNLRLEDALHAYVNRRNAQIAEQKLETLFDPTVYFNSVSSEKGRKMIADQIAEFNKTNEYFEIKPSKYDLGLFVKKSFTKDFEDYPIFMEYTGFKIPQEIAQALPYKYDKMYELTTTDSVVPEICRIDGKEFNFFCYANDPGYNKEANVTFADYGRGRVYIEALKKDYRKGEEIFIHYGNEYWRYNVDYWGGQIQREIALGINFMVDLRRDKLEDVVMKANSVPGPKVVKEDDLKLGYGLQAEKDYISGEFVTNYGGIKVVTKHGDKGLYVVDVLDKDKKILFSLDAEWEFDYRDKGRWINEHPGNLARYGDNVHLVYDENKDVVYFKTSKLVKKGEFFYWYKRSWLEDK